MLVHLCTITDALKEEPEPHLHDGSGDAPGYGYTNNTGGEASRNNAPWIPSNGAAFHDQGVGGGERPACADGPGRQPW